ncbi:MAG: phenylalanine--tRNA ligase subunit beta [bacterium]
MKISYSWLQNYFEEKLPDPEKISEGIIFHSFEVESLDNLETFGKEKEDWVFDIKILPDRAHDCLSHWGIAKEISVIFDLKIKDQKYEIFKPKSTNLKIEIQDEKCFRYMGRIVKKVNVGASPNWLKEKLQAIGQKSINNVVDAANFVMFDLGQPIHCFDLDKLASEKIIVRNGKTGEKLTTLDKKDISLDESILVIADGSTCSPQANEVLAIAGIKGGTKAEVDFNTKNIIIEVANFDATSTRKTAKKIGILTDAVKRYENEISPELCEKAMNAITDLIFELSEGEIEDVVDVYPKKALQKEISISIDYINKRLGTSFKEEEIEKVWQKLNFEFAKDNYLFKIKVPHLRIDITGPHDLTEEVIRVLGYDRLEEKLPEIRLDTKINETFAKMFWARNKLINDGYSEVMTYSFTDTGEVEVLASASDKKFLRNNLSDGLKESLRLNQLNAPLLEMNEIKIFEIGTVFLMGKEEIHVAYNDKKNIIEVSLNDFCKDMSSEPSLELRNYNLETKFIPWSIYPFISRDVSVWVPEKDNGEELKKLLKEEATDLLIRDPYIFDSFTKNGKTSYAFRLVFQSYERTLTDDEINIIMAKISHKIKQNSRWELR